MRDTSAYRLSGIRVPSVTEVLMLAGLVDFGGADPAVLEAARIRGDEADTWISLIELGEIPLEEPAPENVEPYVEGFRAFRKATDWKTTHCQVPFACQRGFAGTPDLRGELGGKRALIDVKCTATISPWVPVQTAGYVHGLELNGEIDKDAPLLRAALWLKGEGRFELVAFTKHSYDRGLFLAALAVAQARLEWGFATLEG